MAPENAPGPRIAVCSWSLRPATPESLVRRIQAIGATAVQLALDPLLTDPATWDAAPNVLSEAGIKVVSGMLALPGEDYSTLETIAVSGGLRPNARWPDHLGHATQIAEIAGRLGLSLVTFHAGFLPERPDDPERKILLDRLHLVADAFEHHGVDLALETGQETAETLVDVLAELDRPTLGVNFDPANMILYGKGDPVAALKTLAPHVRQVHIKDALWTKTPGTWGTEVPVGEGDVDWPAFLAEVGRLPKPVDLVIEREAGEERDGDIVGALKLLRDDAAGG